jgi:glycine/D-amino acid oxidase-like deaminating enzyme
MTARRELRVGILGAGIMGCSLALLLARGGARVTLIDAAPGPFAQASRWNEGKIHLGFLYAGDPSLSTARKLLPGGLAFRSIVEMLVGRPIDDAISPTGDVFLTHRNSVVSAEAMGAYFNRVARMVREHPEAHRYLADLEDVQVEALTPAQLANFTPSAQIVAGFHVPERSVQTRMLADWFVEAVAAEPSIAGLFNCRVAGVVQSGERWRVRATPDIAESFDLIVNALWEGRTAVDRSAGIVDAETRSYRYRVALFARAAKPCSMPSTVIAIGPFGDIKNYNGRDLYLSWYPAGLVADLADIDGLAMPARDAAADRAVIARTVAALAQFFPEVPAALDGADIRVRGGWVVAAGGGSLADAGSALHRRDRFGVSRSGTYISVDTGKYASAPWLARRIASEILG